MTTCSFSMAGGDYERAGSASRSLKELLKTVGVDPVAVRRVMVAAYEAEMNVIIHAHRGTLQATVDGRDVVVDVSDEGPGIPDIALAMKEGYSTAPPKARELGFGAGLGLPNIRKHSDEFSIESTVGKGTRVRFRVRIGALDAREHAFTSMHLHGELCRRCMQCIQVCPTQALRVHRGAPSVLTHLCIECTSCIQTCPAGALSMEVPDRVPSPSPSTVLVLPPAFLFQFGADVAPDAVLAALGALGFADVRLLSGWDASLQDAVRDWARQRQGAGPVISSVCPAVINLVETRFPSLLSDLAPWVTPVEAVVRDLGTSDVVMAVCPAQRTSLLAAGVPDTHLVSPQMLREALRPHAQRGASAPGAPLAGALTGHDPETLRVEGLRSVIDILEDLENGQLQDLQVLELYACNHGCFGSGMMKAGSAALAAHRWQSMGRQASSDAHAFRRERPYAPRSGVRLDPDMVKAMKKLARIEELLRGLPGRDCGQCGAPTCRAFAEDVVLDRISLRACIHAGGGKGNKP